MSFAPWRFRYFLVYLWIGIGLYGVRNVHAVELDSSKLSKIQSETFEVVVPKPDTDPLSYEKPLPLDLLPYQFRNDRFYSIGTAFALGANRYVTAAHVINGTMGGVLGEPVLRDASGQIYVLDKIYKYSLQKDFVVFSLKQPPHTVLPKLNTTPVLNQPVFAVGNALGTGIVIRDGLYTSNTPEEEAGRWTWLRFSAAASPGNSGGPLLDKNGSVMGIVVMKSPNENLNYALPIDEIMKAPEGDAVFDNREIYTIDIFDTTRWLDFRKTSPLPMSYAEFSSRYLQVMNAQADRLLDDLLENQRTTLFPQSIGSNYFLNNSDNYNYEHSYPLLVVRGTDGTWNLAPSNNYRKGLLPDNGYVEYGSTMFDLLLFHLRKPDRVPSGQLYENPKQYMDLLLQAWTLNRNVGDQADRITSLGLPEKNYILQDGYDRRWQVAIWSLPYENAKLTLFSLPVPDGYVSIGRLTQAGADQYIASKDLQVLSNYIYVSYGGTLEQWREYLKNKNILPALFSSLNIDFDYDKNFSYKSDRVLFSYTPELQEITPDSYLRMSFSFFNQDGKWLWDVANVTAKPPRDDTQLIQVIRHTRPTKDLADEFKNPWLDKLYRKPPNDGKVFYGSNYSMIDFIPGVPTKPEGVAPPFLYSVFYRTKGIRQQDEMSAKLDLLLKNLQIYEH
ncbi:hypothetical protein BWP39_30180 [Paraburkholderia acidicola]|uniref:Uncharacterized protein n=1 Tax=Paraburkholderia acidicola TaxID=1912599 RepID=A0A2A4EUG0_9BURK|nr:serine protease [Paraburkholderia acidicola]PCE23954.1 hypothetical protein BWP39_30180 [Paraburkholderia acidicola]